MKLAFALGCQILKEKREDIRQKYMLNEKLSQQNQKIQIKAASELSEPFIAL